MGHSTFDSQSPPCPACDTQSGYLGTLGRLDWWRCPACGLEHDTPADRDPVPESDDWDGADDW